MPMSNTLMSNNTLYLIQSNYTNTENIFSKLSEMLAPKDSVVLLGDSAMLGHSPLLLNIKNIYVLENDALNLPKSVSNDLQIIDYAQFADLVLKFNRCVSLK